jgi:hypothetical protein
MSYLPDAIGYLAAILQFGLLFLIVRGPLSRYFPLFLYIATYLGSTILEGWVLRTDGPTGDRYFAVYWGGELLLDLLLFFLVISLTFRALEGNPQLPKVARFLLLVLAAALVLPFVIFEARVFTYGWNIRTAQLLNFGAAIMNLALWTSLIMNRRRDPQLLTVSAGLGIAMASAAMTFGVRQLTQSDSIGRVAADYAHRALQIASVLIWCWAFRPVRKPAPSAATLSEG